MKTVEACLRNQRVSKLRLDGATYKDKQIVEKLQERQNVTPDFYLIREFEEIPLLVYDEFQRTGDNHRHLQGSKYLGKGRTLTDHYRMYDYQNKYPVVIESTIRDTLRHRIRGEVYLVTPEHIHLIDKMMSHTEKSVRRRVRVSLENQKDIAVNPKLYKNTPYTEAFMYVGIPEWWENFSLELYHRTYRPYLSGEGSEQVFEYDLNTGFLPKDEYEKDEILLAYANAYGYSYNPRREVY